MSPRWTAAEAKHRFSELLNASEKEPQLILRHGKPVGVLVDWKLFESGSRAFQPGIESLLHDLEDINAREGEFEVFQRSDRFDIGSGLS